MECTNMVWECDYVAGLGGTMNIEERCILQNSLTLLQESGKFHKVYFWGKVLGSYNDYFIANGVGKDVLRQRQQFYSMDGKTWALLTPPDSSHLEFSKYVRRQFSGDPMSEVAISIPYFMEDDDDDEEDAGAVDDKKKPGHDDEHTPVITEEERLSSAVQLITEENMIAPRAAFIRTASGEVLLNQFFQGLSVDDAARARSYVHVRFPLRPISQSRVRHSEMERAIDFFDIIDEDIPKGSWSMQMDHVRCLAVVRSLWWPGMVFYHKPNSRIFGQLYLGNGLKNLDLPFML